MSGRRGRGLEIDDPLNPAPSKQPGPPPRQPSAGKTSRVHDDERAERSDRGEAAPTFGGSYDRQIETGTTGRGAVQGGQDGVEHATGRGFGAWREWSGVAGVGSFRLPHELLAELGGTARELGLPVGLIVTAAITQLLDQPPGTIAALVDRADDARIQGRRRARRRLTTRADE
jgi:hypothetical protein